jgi:hypothetical protein
VITLSILVAIVPLMFGCHPVQCGTPTANHCYADVQWTHLPAIQGIQVQITAVQMTSGDGYHITAEAWLIDDSGNWIELGQIARNGQSPVYFWADKRPGHDFAEHDLAPVAQAQFGWPVFYEVSQNSNSSNTYRIFISSSQWSYSGESTDNRMIAANWMIGQEMAGSTNRASSGTATYSNLIAVDTSFAVQGLLAVHAEKTRGAMQIYSPPFGSWSDAPQLTGDLFPGQEAVSSGTFQTSCC